MWEPADLFLTPQKQGRRIRSRHIKLIKEKEKKKEKKSENFIRNNNRLATECHIAAGPTTVTDQYKHLVFLPSSYH